MITYYIAYYLYKLQYMIQNYLRPEEQPTELSTSSLDTIVEESEPFAGRYDYNYYKC